MKSEIYVVVLLFIGASLKYSVKALEVKCGGIDIKITEEHMMEIMECIKAAGITKITDLTPATAGCFSKCVMEKKGLVDGSGKPHKENIMKAIDEGLPAALLEPWKSAMEKCLDNEGGKIKSPDDATCSSYMPLVLCVHGAFINICKG